MKRSTGLSLEEHKALGVVLREIRNTLAMHGDAVAKRYPKTSKVTKRALKTHMVVDALRRELSSQLFAEHPGEPGLDDVYF